MDMIIDLDLDYIDDDQDDLFQTFLNTDFRDEIRKGQLQNIQELTEKSKVQNSDANITHEEIRPGIVVEGANETTVANILNEKRLK